MLQKLPVLAIPVILGLTSAGYAAAGGLGGPRPVAPVILSATADFKENLMVISGHHFGTTPPTVTLAHRVLKVKSFSKDRVVVDLPAGIEPATYRLTLMTNGLHRLTSSPFSAAIFALAEIWRRQNTKGCTTPLKGATYFPNVA